VSTSVDHKSLNLNAKKIMHTLTIIGHSTSFVQHFEDLRLIYTAYKFQSVPHRKHSASPFERYRVNATQQKIDIYCKDDIKRIVTVWIIIFNPVDRL
jgi:hypothetical protein